MGKAIFMVAEGYDRIPVFLVDVFHLFWSERAIGEGGVAVKVRLVPGELV
jgi:hypothetical protein